MSDSIIERRMRDFSRYPDVTGELGATPSEVSALLQEIDSLRTELAACREREARMRALIADDSYAMTFQSFGRYRTALLRELAEGAQG